MSTMSWSILLALAVVSGTVSGDTLCVIKETLLCTIRYFLTIQGRDPTNFCKHVPQQNKCIDQSSITCHEASNPLVRNVTDKLTEVCTEGTVLNDEYHKHRECVFGKLNQITVDCAKDFIRALRGLGTPRATKHYEDESIKLGCRYTISLNQCVYDKIKDDCGEDAESFLRELKEPDLALANQPCRDRGLYPFNETTVYVSKRSYTPEDEATPNPLQMHLFSTLSPTMVPIDLGEMIMSPANINLPFCLNLLLALLMIKLFSNLN